MAGGWWLVLGCWLLVVVLVVGWLLRGREVDMDSDTPKGSADDGERSTRYEERIGVSALQERKLLGREFEGNQRPQPEKGVGGLREAH